MMKKILRNFLVAIIIIILVVFVFYFLFGNPSEEYTISGKIEDVVYQNIGLSDYFIKVFFEDKPSFTIDYVYETNSDRGLDSVYLLLKNHIGNDITIKYSKSLIGENGFVEI